MELAKRIKRFGEVILFTQITPIVARGRLNPLGEEDIPDLPTKLRPSSVGHSFDGISVNSDLSFLWGILKVLRSKLIFMAVLNSVVIGLQIVSPLLLHKIITSISELTTNGDHLAEGLMWAVLLSLSSMGSAVFLQHYFYGLLCSQQIAVNGLNHLIFAKTLKLSRSSLQKRPTGDVVNLIGTDTDAVSQFSWVLIELLSILVLTIAAGFMLYNFIGVAALVGMGAFLVVVPLAGYLGRRFVKIEEQIMTYRDQRVSQMAQILNGIRIIKYFAWERFAARDIDRIRSLEVKGKYALALAHAWSVLVFLSMTTLVSAVTLGAYVVLGHTLDAATVFTSLAILSLLNGPAGHLTRFISMLAAARVGAHRIRQFLLDDEKPMFHRDLSPASKPIGIKAKHLSGQHDVAEKMVIDDLSIEIEPGSSVAIVGPVGSGKSSLLLMLAGEIPAVHGTLKFTGIPSETIPRMAYVPQKPFVRNTSVKENLEFGQDHPDLNAAIQLTCLDRDLKLLARGLDTEIGEHGINLSGGQKQRLSLARTTSMQPGLVLLDDPLSALDPDTEKSVVDELIFGHWAKITRIVVTHRLDHLQHFDRILFLEEGKIVADGSFESLNNHDSRFARFYLQHSKISDQASHPSIDQGQGAQGDISPDRGDYSLILSEDRETGAVSTQVYWDYLRALGGDVTRWRPKALIALSLLAIFSVALPIAQNYWLALWTNQKPSVGVFGTYVSSFLGSENRNILIFTFLGFGVLGIAFAQHLLWSFAGVRAGMMFHQKAFQSVLATTLRFFDGTPIGRILNRFSRDVDATERELAWSFQEMITSLLTTIGSMLVMIFVLPWIVMILLPVLYFYYLLQRDYRSSSREVKRMFSMSKSPRFSHFKETLEGLLVIRSMNSQPLAWKIFDQTLTHHQKMFHGMVLLNRWFSVRVPLLSGVISLGVICGLVFAAHRGLMDSGAAGLVLIYSLSLWQSLNWSIRSFSETESAVTSVERLMNYSKLPQEESISKPCEWTEEEIWPSHGEITFDHVVCGYDKRLGPILKGLSFTVAPMQKVGIVGRTGAGKSTVFQSLFRFVDVWSGSIKIDGKDIAGIPLEVLRSQIAIIPQDPILFDGTLRFNLDPKGELTEYEMWEALRRVELEEFIIDHLGSLDVKIHQNGTNLSQGQRQLLCLARALLMNSKIIAMDEATASVDVETDSKIQETLLRECKDKTVLIIAHRLGTVKQCDMILQLSDGILVDQWSPSSDEVLTFAAGVSKFGASHRELDP